MSQLDVTELLTDPVFVDKVLVVNRSTQVNSKGENLLDEEIIPTVGSVQPASGKTIMRLPEDMRVANIMTFWIKGAITASIPGKYTTVLVFRGQRFEVQMIFDWTAAGAGWSEGVCIAAVAAP